MVKYIEIIGLGGAGKTTLLEKVSKKYYNSNVQFIFPSNNLIKNLYIKSFLFLIRLLLINPRMAFGILLFKDERWLFKKIAFRLYSLRNTKKNKINILIDSGFYEPLISHAMFFSGKTKIKVYRNYIKILKKPLAVICFDVNNDIGLKRFINREKLLKRIKDYDLNELEKNFIKAGKVYTQIKKKLSDSGIELIIIDGNKEIYDNVNESKLISSIDSLVSR